MQLTSGFVQNWIEIDEEYETDIEMRRELLAKQKNIVIATTPEVCTCFLSLNIIP